MNLTIGVLYFFAFILTIVAPPVVENAKRGKDTVNTKDNDDDSKDSVNDLEYSRYLKEVVEILESDPDFKKKLESASVDDIKSGNIAEHLSLVQHRVRTQLDEAKQREMARLKDLVGQKFRNLNDKQRLALSRADPNGRKMREFLPQHVDHRAAETFGRLDLERLIQHASRDLEQLDREREDKFKEYEMRKEYQRRNQLAKMTVEQRDRLEKLHREALEKKKRHPKVNHPGSVDQMEEIWEGVDKLDADQFKPKAFFKLHDVNSDGFIDEAELEAIMLKEAAKIHDGMPEADSVERQEEMDRMRQHVMKEFDKNNDRMLSLDEFQLGLNGTEAKNDQGWQSIEDNAVFSDQDFQRFAEKMSLVSTSIPPHQTPSSTIVSQQSQNASEAVQHPPPEQKQAHIPRAPPEANIS